LKVFAISEFRGLGCALEKISRETKEAVGGSNHVDLFSNALVWMRGQWSHFEAMEGIGEALVSELG
jgi:hypothetical protein